MKEFFEKLDLTEFFAHLCPGAIVLCSISLWITPSFKAAFGEEVAGHELVAVALIIIVAYALGVLVASLSGAGADYYIRTYNNPLKKPSGLLLPTWWAVCFCNLLPTPRSTPSLVEGQLRISEALEKDTGLLGLSMLQNPWDRLAIYRIVISNKVGEKGKAILTEAEWVHRRLLFSLGVALALLILSLQAALRLLLLGVRKWEVSLPWFNSYIIDLEWQVLAAWRDSLPKASVIILLVITAFGFVASFGLRRIAGRLWERELLLTCSLIQLEPRRDVTFDSIPVA